MPNYIKILTFTILGFLIFSCSDTSPIQKMDSSNTAIAAKKIKEITVNELSESLLANYLIIDVRELEELKTGVIPNAIHIPMGKISTKLPEYLQSNFKNKTLDELKDKSILLYCRSGNRSYHSIETLQQQGFTNLTSLDGGFNAYKQKFPD